MKKVLDEQRHGCLEELENGELTVAKLRASFDAIDTELGWFLAKLDGDARKMEMAAPKLPVTGELVKNYAAMLRAYADMLRGEKKEESRIILPFGSPSRTGGVNGS